MSARKAKARHMKATYRPRRRNIDKSLAQINHGLDNLKARLRRFCGT